MSGASRVGSLAGTNRVTLTAGYAAGPVSGASAAGGLVGVTELPAGPGDGRLRTASCCGWFRRVENSGTPADLLADTSTGIVFNYLARPDLHVVAGARGRGGLAVTC